MRPFFHVLIFCITGTSNNSDELRAAIDSIEGKGFYYSEMVTVRLIHTINQLDEDDSTVKNLKQLNECETEFLKLACSELTYKEMADKMFLSPRTIDG